MLKPPQMTYDNAYMISYCAIVAHFVILALIVLPTLLCNLIYHG